MTNAYRSQINAIAKHLAILKVKDSIKRQGKKLSAFHTSQIVSFANDLVQNDPRYKSLAEGCAKEVLSHD